MRTLWCVCLLLMIIWVSARKRRAFEVFSCFEATCITPKVCIIDFVNGYPVSGLCALHQSTVSPCNQTIKNGKCECASSKCMTDNVPPTTTTLQPTQTTIVEEIPCLGESCFTPRVCSVYYENSIPIFGKCSYKQNLPQCDQSFMNGNCECDTPQCMTNVVPMTTSPKPNAIEVIDCFGSTCLTPRVCDVHFDNHIPVSGKCSFTQSNLQKCGNPFPSTGDCQCESRFCMNIINTLTTTPRPTVTSTPLPTASSAEPFSSVTNTSPVTNEPISTVSIESTTYMPPSSEKPTTTPVTLAPTTNSQYTVRSTETTIPTIACNDKEDSLFNCQTYNNNYGMCTSLTPTLQKIAHERCPKFCNICGQTGTPTKSPETGSNTMPPCVDHDPRCSEVRYKSLLCNASAPQTKEFTIQTCPKTCNYCTEYFASFIEAPECHICGDFTNLIPCDKQSIDGNFTSTKCPDDHKFCMTDLYQDNLGNKDVFKRCVDESTCLKRWIRESANLDYCKNYGSVNQQLSAIECHFCCAGKHCNSDIMPPKQMLVSPIVGK